MTPADLKRICPRCPNPEQLAGAIAFACDKYGIKDRAMFIAQLAHESGEFRYVRELASGEAYEGRRDLGNTEAGDGPRFKGRGYLQVTGRANFEKCAAFLGIDCVSDPSLLEQHPWALFSACWFWVTRKIDGLSLKDATRRINGGFNGLASRAEYYKRAQEVFNGHSKDETAMSPFILPALEAITSAVPALMSIFGDKGKTVPERNAEAAVKVVEAAKTVLGAPNEQEVVRMLKTDPEAPMAVKKAVEGIWFELQESGGGGIGGARAYNLEAAKVPAWKQPAFLITCLLLPLIYGVAWSVVYGVGWDDNIRSFVVGVIIGSTLGAIVAYWLGSSIGSKDKTDAMLKR